MVEAIISEHKNFRKRRREGEKAIELDEEDVKQLIRDYLESDEPGWPEFSVWAKEYVKDPKTENPVHVEKVLEGFFQYAIDRIADK